MGLMEIEALKAAKWEGPYRPGRQPRLEASRCAALTAADPAVEDKIIPLPGQLISLGVSGHRGLTPLRRWPGPGAGWCLGGDDLGVVQEPVDGKWPGSWA